MKLEGFLFANAPRSDLDDTHSISHLTMVMLLRSALSQRTGWMPTAPSDLTITITHSGDDMFSEPERVITGPSSLQSVTLCNTLVCNRAQYP